MPVICRLPSGGNAEIKPAEIVVTADIINQGTWYNGSHSVLSNQVNGSAGFTLVGTRKYAYNVTAIENQFVCWCFRVDLTHYSKISYYVKKNVNHGSSVVRVTSSMSNNASSGVVGKHIGYADLSTSWTKYEIDVSAVSGEYYITFIGGYLDNSGSTSSSTSYCDIHIT